MQFNKSLLSAITNNKYLPGGQNSNTKKFLDRQKTQLYTIPIYLAIL